MSVRRYSLNFAPRPTPRGRDGKELIQCPTSSCDGMGHVSGNYATHRRQGNIDVYTKSLTLDYVYIDIWRCSTHARTLRIHIHRYTYNRHGSMPVPLFCLLEARDYILHPGGAGRSRTRPERRQRTYTHKTRFSKLARAAFTWMVPASMHIGGPWRSCFLSVCAIRKMRLETPCFLS